MLLRVAALRELLLRLKSEGKTIAAYAAAAKGCTLINYVGATTDVVASGSGGLYRPGTPLAVVTALTEGVLKPLWAAWTALKAARDEVLDAGPGWAELAMTVTETMVNGHGIGHGGYVFLFADTAFACACSFYRRI